MKTVPMLLFGAAVSLLCACAQVPTGPGVAVMPAPGKPFEVFQQDDGACRAYASRSVGTDANDASTKSLLESGAVGVGLGAAAGALIGGGRGAGEGAALGALAGTAVGAREADKTGRTIQRRYDIAYEQCMYSRGNVLPGQSASRYPGIP
jgi:hypothetical protein